MRPKFVLALFGVALLVVGAAWFLKQHPENTSTPASSKPEAATIPAAGSDIVENVSSSSPALASSAPLSPPPAALTPEERQAASDAEIDRLQASSMNNDPASLSNILADLTYPDKAVREAAIEAAKQFGSSDAVPVLRELAANDEDPDEKAALLDAADFLSLPSLTLGGPGTGPPMTPEQIQTGEQKRAAMEARRQALMQKHAQNQNSQSATPPANGQNPSTAPNH